MTNFVDRICVSQSFRESKEWEREKERWSAFLFYSTKRIISHWDKVMYCVYFFIWRKIHRSDGVESLDRVDNWQMTRIIIVNRWAISLKNYVRSVKSYYEWWSRVIVSRFDFFFSFLFKQVTNDTLGWISKLKKYIFNSNSVASFGFIIIFTKM